MYRRLWQHSRGGASPVLVVLANVGLFAVAWRLRRHGGACLLIFPAVAFLPLAHWHNARLAWCKNRSLPLPRRAAVTFREWLPDWPDWTYRDVPRKRPATRRRKRDSPCRRRRRR